MSQVYDQAARAARAIRSLTDTDAFDAAVVLGSGLGSFATRDSATATVPYSEVPGFPIPAADGHDGLVASLLVGGNRILVLSGRVHAYEGYPIDAVVLPVRAAIATGARAVVLTNASGSISAHLQPGDLTVVRDHINLAGINPLVGQNDRRLGTRFPDLTTLYTPRLREVATRAAEKVGLGMQEVVYAWWLGPTYETPSEIRMIQTLGADVVGMSTVPEAIAAGHMGAEVLALSLVTNHAAGLSDTPPSSEDVIATARDAQADTEALLQRILSSPDLIEG